MGEKRRNMISDHESLWQIPTTRRTIRREMQRWACAVPETLCKCIQCGPGSIEYERYLLVAAVILERVASLVYRNRDGQYCKPSSATYQAELFEPYAEFPSELLEHALLKDTNPETAQHVHKIFWQITNLVCPMMASMTEHGFVNEYAYAIDYVIRHDGDLPKPETNGFCPENYETYRYWEVVTEGTGAFAEIAL